MVYILVLELLWATVLNFLPLKIIYKAQVAISAILVTISFSLVSKLLENKVFFELQNYLFADSLNILLIAALFFLVFCVAIYSIGYLQKEESNGVEKKRIKVLYFWMNLFIFCMSLALFSNNFGIAWIAIEGTTLSTTFLIGFYNTKESVKASWQYIIICSFGLALGLFGIVTLYFTTYSQLGEGMLSLNWTNIMQIAGGLNPALLKIAFVFFLVGFGTKAGLAPMHSWLPDAHAQAPTPISALMSGVLLSSAFYVILRFKTIANKAGIGDFTNHLLLIVGMLSIFIATIAIIRQNDYKRLLAYSSMEHMGLIAFAFGIGSKLGIFAGLLHMINHVFAKGLMFSSVGSILVNFHTRNISSIKGLYKSMPLTALFVTLAVLGITGVPPFNIFISEFFIVTAAFQEGMYYQVIFVLALLAIIFGGFLYLFSSMLMGESKMIKKEDYRMLFPMALLALVMLYFGITMPPHFATILNNAVDIINTKGV